MKNKIYTTIGIVGLIGVMCFVIYLIGNFIYFGVREINEICNRNTINDSFYGGDRVTSTYNDCIDNNINNYSNNSMLEPDYEYSPPVKGMYSNDSLDSLISNKHIDLSGIDGDNFYSRDLNPINRNITPRFNNYTTYDNNEVEVKLPTKVTLKPSIIQVFSDRVSYDVTYSY